MNTSTQKESSDLEFLAGGGHMGQCIRAHDWSATPLGMPRDWPQSLRTSIRFMLNTWHPMYIWWGADLLCLYNDAYSACIGPERHPGSLGKPCREVWTEIWEDIGPQIDQVMSGRGPTWHENHLLPITRHGRLEDVYWTYSFGPIDEPQAPHQVGGVMVICTETTATVLAEQNEAAEVLRQRQIFMQAPGFIIVMHGHQHRVEFINDAHRRLFGSAGWLGKTIREAIPDLEGQGFFELLDNVYLTGQTYKAKSAEIHLRRPSDGAWDTKFLDFTYAPILDAKGLTTGIYCEGIDVTEQRRAALALQANEEQLRLAVESGDVGLWDVDMVADRLYWPPRVKAMFGISPSVEVTLQDFYQGLHPDDFAHTNDAFAAAMDPVKKALYDVEYRTVGREDGITRWVAAKGRALFDEKDRCIRVIGTVIDVTNRKHIETQLAASQAKLKETDRHKDEFLATLAHELRNPLAPVRNVAMLLQRPGLDPQSVPRLGQMIERQTKFMASLLDDLLEVTRINVGKIELKKAAVKVGSVVEIAWETSRLSFEPKGHAFELQMACADALVMVDPLRVAQVLTNLLNNAAKYSDPGGNITLRANTLNGELRFDVIDEGIGLDPGDVGWLFEMFGQSTAALGRAQGGLGIGLAVAKGLVELHGGRIQAASPGRGRGSTFTVVLPMGLASAPLATRELPSVTAVAPVGDKKVLVVDDNVDAADSFAAILRLEGFSVEIAYDSHTAMKRAKEQLPAACLLDIGMPGMDGYELAAKIRGILQSSGARPPLLIATTGWGQMQDRERSRMAGFDAHLIKPLDFSTVTKLLSDHRDW